MKNNSKLIIGIVVVVLVLAASFYGGMIYGQNKKSNRGNFPNMANGQKMNGSNGGMVNGEITAKDDKSITVKLSNGGSKIVFFSESTQVSKSIAGVLSDLQVGEKVMAAGTTNEDGSVTAKTIQLGSAISFGQPPAGNNQSGQTNSNSGEQNPPQP